MDLYKHFLIENKLISPDELTKTEQIVASESRTFWDVLFETVKLDSKSLRKAFVNSFKKKPFFQILLEQGLISIDELKQFEVVYNGIPANLGNLLVEKKIISEEDCAKALAKEFGLEYVELSSYKVDEKLFNSVDLALMREFSFIPDLKNEKEIFLIMAEPSNVDAIEDLEVRLGLPIVPKVSTRKSIQRLISLMVETSLDSKLVFSDLESVPKLELVHEKDNDDEAGMAGEIHLDLGEESPVIKLVDSIILKAVRKRASDIHFEVYESRLKVKYRIDGVLFEVLSDVEPRMRGAVISRLKVMAQLDIAEKRVTQDGRFKLKIDERFVDFRVSVLPAIFGETIVLRILDKSALGLDLKKVGLDGNDLTVFQRNIRKPYGMILVAGPTGSGKTTTLYSAIKTIHSSGDKFITIEDPVEYQLPDIVQVAVNEKKGLTFSSGLRSIVRQDPDKIMVGEIRDPETAQIAVNAALTGHLVLSTIHANNVTDAISRLVNMKVDPYEFVSSFNLILSQRLIRKICASCKKEDNSISEEEKKLTLDFSSYGGMKFFKGEGCRYCHQTGFQGRTGIFEVLELSPRIKQMVLSRASPLLIRKTAMEEGMVTLRQAGWKKVESGDTTFQEMNRVTFEEGMLE
ncbi:MAG: type II/IV secretion system protein [Candidatus Riflebacteria bacterium]|nr:type II/IV secretion system protein [Candidatus Riflebacteria bacterium]